MKPRSKFIVGAFVITVSVGFLMASGVKETGVYFVTPVELAEKVAADTHLCTVWVSGWVHALCQAQ